MRIFISIVSHFHLDIINNLSVLRGLANHKSVTVILRDNVGEIGLSNYCEINNIEYLKNDKCFGFAKNNNMNFEYINETYDISDDDYFLILNPDVYLTIEQFNNFYNFLDDKRLDFVSILQYSDSTLKKIEPSARYFNGVFGFLIEKYVTGRELLIPNSGITSSFDWVSGAFMAVKVSLFRSMNGFCDSYYMYYEDADFCLRCKLAGYHLSINTDIFAIHYAQYGNRKLFSKLFIFSLISYTRFLLRLYLSYIRQFLK